MRPDCLVRARRALLLFVCSISCDACSDRCDSLVWGRHAHKICSLLSVERLSGGFEIRAYPDATTVAAQEKEQACVVWLHDYGGSGESSAAELECVSKALSSCRCLAQVPRTFEMWIV
jgi:hypothetical protein